MSFFSKLHERITAIDSMLCVGLDPHPGDLPENNGKSAFEFCRRIIEATSSIAAAYKPNSAFFEAIEAGGWESLKEVIAYIPEDIPVILDAKRGDIASTAAAYAKSVFEVIGADAVTISPYLGYDSVSPFVDNPDKGVFVLCKTSNLGAGDFQDLLVDDHQQTLYEQIAQSAANWNNNDNVGLVVGATQPDALRRVRSIAPDLYFLAPGIGAQGGSIELAMEAGLRHDGYGMLIPVSRGISKAEDPGEAARKLRDQFNEVQESVLKVRRQSVGKPQFPVDLKLIADGLLEIGCIRFGSFTLKSGLQSPIYIDLRRLAGHPRLLKLVGKAYARKLRSMAFDHLGALPYAAMPIGTAVSLSGGWSMVYPRKEAKSYGTKAKVEGVYNPGDRVVVIDDLITTGLSKFEGIEKFVEVGLDVVDVVVLIDRQMGGLEKLKERNYRLHAIFKIHDLLDYYEEANQISAELVQQTRDYLDSVT